MLTLVQLGVIKTLLGNSGETSEIVEECIRLCVEHGERWNLSYALWAQLPQGIAGVGPEPAERAEAISLAGTVTAVGAHLLSDVVAGGLLGAGLALSWSAVVQRFADEKIPLNRRWHSL